MGGFREYFPGNEVLADEINEYVMRQVVGQYATSSTRNAEVYPVKGMCSTLDTHPGMLWVWTGSTWTPHVPMRASAVSLSAPTGEPGADIVGAFTQSGASIQVTDGSAAGGITFPEPFASPPPVVLITDHTSNTTVQYQVAVINGSPNTTRFGFVVRSHTGIPILDSTVHVAWLAIGQRAS